MRIIVYRSCLGFLIAVLLSGVARSQNSTRPIEPKTTDDSAILRFQRLLVPADRPEDWPRDPAAHYLPMPADEFDRRIRQLRDGLVSPAFPTTAQLVRASYVADLSDDSLHGRLEWKFEQQGSTPGIVPLGDCQFALSNFAWISDQASQHATPEQSSANPKDAVVGNDSQGKLVAIVDRSGTLKAHWSLDGQKANDSALVFDLQLPNCTVNRLQLTLPTKFTASISNASVSTVEQLNAKQRQWTFELGQVEHASLRIETDQLSTAETSKSFTCESFRYGLTEHGLELDAQFRLAVLNPPLRQIRLTVDPQLTVLHAQIENTELHIGASSPSRTNQQTEQILELTVPPTTRDDKLVLRVHATAPFPTQTLFRLPFVHVADSNWQTGEAQLFVPQSLAVDDIVTTNCRQTVTAATSDPTLGRFVSLQLFNAEPQVDLKLSPPIEQLRLRQSTSVTLRPNEGTGRFIGDFTVHKGVRFDLDAQIAPDWIIEDVDSVPAGGVTDWSQRLARNLSGKLHILLNNPLTPQNGLRLSVTGRRRSAPWGKSLHDDELAMLQFSDAIGQRRIVNVQTTENYRLQINGADELNRLDPEHISAEDAVLLKEKPSGLTYVDDDNATNLAVSLASKAPQYEASIQSLATVEDDRLTESYRFSIMPKAREVARVVVRLSQLRNTPIVWSIEGEPDATVTARRLTESEGSVVSWPGDVWEVVLASPRAAPFVLRASRSTPLADDMPLGLASLLDAETQQGTIQICSTAAKLPEIRSRRLKTIPVDPSESDQSAADLAAFRYDPEEDTLLTAEPPLVVAPNAAGANLARAWIWLAQLSCRYSRNGVESTLTCRIENTGQDPLQFEAPAGAELESIVIDGQRVNKLASNGSDWRIALPNGKRFATLVLMWIDRHQQIDGAVSTCTALWPEVDVPILSRQWSISLPPSANISDLQIGNSHLFDASWTKRLFGPLVPAPSLSAESFRVVNEVPPSSAPVNQTQTALTNTATITNQATSALTSLQPPWNKPDRQWDDDSNWNCYRFDAAGATDRMWVADVRLLSSWAWSLFLLVLAARWWFGNRNSAVEVSVMGLATVVALIIPASWAPLGAAVWLGLVAGKLIAWVSSYTRSTTGTAKPNTTTVLSQKTIATASLIVLSALIVSQGLATEPSAQNSPPQPVSEKPDTKVFVPTDQGGHPMGGLYYVPEAFHDELLRATGGDYPAPQYVITSASYGPLTNNSAKDPAYDDWQAKYVIESLVDQIQVKLPLGFDGAALVPDAIKVDGQPAQFGNDNPSRSVLVTIEHRGSHRIDIVLHPAADSKGFSFAIPHVTNSQLDLQGIDTHRYRIEIESGNDNAPTDLLLSTIATEAHQSGISDKILLRLAEANSPAEVPTIFDINALYWLRIRPNSVTVNTRFHLNVQSGSVRQLHLHVDPRWQPVSEQEISTGSDRIAVSQIRSSGKENSEWVIDLAHPATGNATVTVVFRLDSDSSIGRWQPLNWTISGARNAQCWWGATVSKELRYSISPIENGRSITPEKFAALWPSQNDLPQITWQPAVHNEATYITTWPAESKLTAKYLLAAIASLKDLEVRLASQVNIADGPIFQLRVHVPPSLQIDRIVSNTKDAAQPLRWSRSDADSVTLFFDAPTSGQCNLLLRGRLPLSTEPKIALPQMDIEKCSADGFRALIFRRPEVLINGLAAAELQQAADSDFPAAIFDAEGKGLLEPRSEKNINNRQPVQPQLVSVLNGQDFKPATFEIGPNQPQIRTVQVATLTRNADAWLTSLNVDFQIESGVIDTLRFDLPANWIGPFEISPALPHSVEDIIGENRQQLVVRPEKPLQDKFSLKISGPLTIAAGQRASAPDVRLAGAARQSRFFLLPRRLENQQLAWETRGLIPRPLPESVGMAVSDPSSYRAYQLVGDRCRAELRSIEPSTENAQVRFMDVEWSWDPNGDHRGVAAFDLEPGAATTCEIKLPANSHLVQAELDSTPAQLSTEGDNRWGIWLGDNKMPRHLEVVFQGSGIQPSTNPTIIPALTLVDLPVKHQLWAVRSPVAAGEDRKSASTSISPLRHALLRLENAASAMESAAGLLLDESASDISRWYATWLRRFIDCRTELIVAKKANATEDLALNADAQLNAIDQEQAKLARKIDAAKREANVSSNAPIVASDWLHLAALVSTKDNAAYGTTNEGGQVSLVYDRAACANPMSRYFAAAAVGILTLALILTLRLTNSQRTHAALNS